MSSATEPKVFCGVLTMREYFPEFQRKLIRWAKSYEEDNISLVPDSVYDYTVKEMIEYQQQYPQEFLEHSLEEFLRDDSWQYTGSFYR